jgi:plasmid stabilization system protein ParE
MVQEVVWTRGAEADLLACFEDLEEKQPGYGQTLVSVVDAQISLLRQFPEMAPVFEGSIRRLVLKDRKHGLFYAVEGKRIVLHALADLRSDQEHLKRRFKKLIGP